MFNSRVETWSRILKQIKHPQNSQGPWTMEVSPSLVSLSFSPVRGCDPGAHWRVWGWSEHLLVKAVLNVRTSSGEGLMGAWPPRGGQSQAGHSSPEGQVLALLFSTCGRQEGCDAMWIFIFEMIRMWVFFPLVLIYAKKLPVTFY